MGVADPQVMAIFCEALECRAPQERAAYLDQACGSDAGLRARVKALLRAHGEAGEFLGGGSSAAGTTTTIDEGLDRDGQFGEGDERTLPPTEPQKVARGSPRSSRQL
jgi:hypothetical protein